jgi:hypothetical protein
MRGTPMKVEFWDRTPGGHTLLVTVEMDAVPREGDAVSLTPDSKAHSVHKVSWVVESKSVRVLLN